MTWPSVIVQALVFSFAIDAVVAVGLKAARAFSSARARLVFGHLLLAPAGLAAGPGMWPAGGTASSSAVGPPRCAKERSTCSGCIPARRFSIINVLWIAELRRVHLLPASDLNAAVRHASFHPGSVDNACRAPEPVSGDADRSRIGYSQC